jgi:putative inorganic carbon (HCO3(-)) transporter
MTERLTFNTKSLGSERRPAKVAESSDSPIAETAAVIPERRDWAFLFMIAFTALVFLRPQDTIPPLEYLHLAELCAIGGLAALVSGRLGRNQPVTRMTPELVGVIALGGLILATAPFSIWFGGAIGVFNEIYVKIILIFLLMVNVLTSLRRIERLRWLLVLASGYLAFRAVLDYARGINVVSGRVEGAVGGIFKNPNDLALNMVAFLPFAIFIALRPGSMMRRATAGLCAVLMVGAVVASHSRAGSLGLVAMLGVLGLSLLKHRPGLVIGGLIVVSLTAPLLPASYWRRIASITDGSKDDSGSRESRRQLLHESFQAFIENPMTGVGAGQFRNWNPEGRVAPWRESHDVLLQVAAELGAGGLAVLLYLIVRGAFCVRESRRLLRQAALKSTRGRGRADAVGKGPPRGPRLSPAEYDFLDAHSAATAAALVGWFVCALFASVAYNWTFYYLLALAAAPRDVLMARLVEARIPRRARAEAHVRLEVARV